MDTSPSPTPTPTCNRCGAWTGGLGVYRLELSGRRGVEGPFDPVYASRVECILCPGCFRAARATILAATDPPRP